MGGLSSFLFGDAPGAEISSKDTLQDFQKKALEDFILSLQKQGAPATAVPVTEDQQTLIDKSVPAASSAQGNLDKSNLVLNELLTNFFGREPIDTGTTTTTTPFKDIVDRTPEATAVGDFAAQVQDPLIHDFRTTIMPQISRGFGNDFFSSERQKQDRLATDDLLRALAKEKSGFLRDDRSHRLNELRFGLDDRRFQTDTNLAGLEKDKVNLLIERLGLDKTLAGLQEQGLGVDIAKAAAGNLESTAGTSADILSEFLGTAGVGRDIAEKGAVTDEALRQELLKLLLGASTATTKETVGVGFGGREGSLAGFLEGLGQGLGQGAAASDRRLKHGIVQTGWLSSGIATYNFSYLGSTARFHGVMAQDVLPILPEAVITMPNGFYAVNYSKLY